MSQTDDLKVFKSDARKLIKLARIALNNKSEPETTQELHEEDAEAKRHADTVWEQFTNRMVQLVESAYATVPEGVTLGSQRSQIIEQAVKEITENIIKYPGTPHTGSNALNLGEMLKSLEISKRIDADDETKKT